MLAFLNPTCEIYTFSFNHKIGETMEHTKMTKSMAKFCKEKCPVCVNGRKKGEGFLYNMIKLEENMCPACRAYKKVYGVYAHEKVKED